VQLTLAQIGHYNFFSKDKVVLETTGPPQPTEKKHEELT